jgi:hypothetical protein
MELGALVARLRTRVELRHPPECPPGARTGAPDFVGVGAQRSGTTWWYDVIASHPGVQRSEHKELHYFHRFHRRALTDADVATYARWFPRAEGLLAGEWSPGYLAHFWIPPLLRRAAPDAKVLVALRDPVERYLSGLALQEQTRRPSAASASTAFRLGCYGSQLEHLLHWFPRDQVFVLQFEQATKDPARELGRTFRFLGLDDGFVSPDVGARRNESRGAKPPLPAEQRAALVHAYEPEVRRVQAIVADLDLSLWPNFATLA